MRFSENTPRRQGPEVSKQVPPRICMATGRNFTKRAFQCGHYEAQDVLSNVDAVDLIHLESGPRFWFIEHWQRRLLFRDVSKKLISLNPGLHRVRLTREYDLFVAFCQTYWDLLHINAIDGWKDRCKTSVCWLDEMWASEIPRHKYWLHALRKFDHVCVGYHGSVSALSKAIDRPCHWVPGAVDALRFSPYPNPTPRAVDVYSIGRRWDGIHRKLLAAAGRKEIFYVYDTFPRIAEMHVHDHQQHRDLFANLAKRSRYFIVAPGKMDSPEETQGQVEIGFRYYEGAAAGTVMIGQPPSCDAFTETFPWPDVVIPIRPDGADVMDVLASLDSEPERVSAISRRNTSEALLRHDWVYRWKDVFQVAGLEPSRGMVAREQQLKNVAELAREAAGDGFGREQLAPTEPVF